MVNFTVITYTLAIERLPELKGLFPNMGSWLMFFTIFYIPIALIIGYWHRKKQLPTEIEISAEENPYKEKLLSGIGTMTNAYTIYSQQYNIQEIEFAIKDTEFAKVQLTITRRNMELHNTLSEKFGNGKHKLYNEEDFKILDDRFTILEERLEMLKTHIKKMSVWKKGFELLQNGSNASSIMKELNIK